MFIIAIKSLVALIFATAGLGKLRQGPAFEGVVANFRVLPAPVTKPFAWSLPWMELALAAGLWVPGPTGLIAQVLAAVLLLAFGVAMAINIRRGRVEIDCGCFQTAGRQPLGWSLVGRNLMLAIALVAGLAAGAPVLGVVGWANGLAAGLALFLLYLAGGELAALHARAQLASKGVRA